MHEKRQSQEYRLQEKQRKSKTMNREAERLQKWEKRESEEYRLQEKRSKSKTMDREAEKLQKREKRESEEYRLQEKRSKSKTVDKGAHKLHMHGRRESQEYRLQEKRSKSKTMDREAERLQKREKRESEEYRLQEKQNKIQVITLDDLIETFHRQVLMGPEYVCTCCDQLWYRHSVRLATPGISKNIGLQERCVTGYKSAENKEWICGTCHRLVKSGKLPPLAKANKTVFPVLPHELNLTNLEERLVAPRIPFMQLRELPRGGQISLHGNVVNVPTNVNTTVCVLPRRQDDTATIALKLKRKLSYKHHYQFETVRPNRVIDAVNWLVNNSDLYKQEGIHVDKDWTLTENEDTMETDGQSSSSLASVEAEKDDWDETADIQQPTGSLDTMMQNIMEDARQIISMAPGEGGKPLSIFLDKYAEELSFPTLYCGQARPDNKEREVSVFYGELCKSELRRQDRRVASHLPDLFFKAKKLQMKHILDKANICLRKTKGSRGITAGDLKSQEYVQNLIRHDDGYRVFRDLRGSPPYWEKVKKDIFALIRQLGIPTWFTSFSSAETKWHHVLQILGKTVEGKTYTDTEVDDFTWQQKQHLIQSDPVTCARHFDYQVQKLINTVLKSPLDPIGHTEDFFYKVEFQMRGSPHIHMLLWTADSPKVDSDKPEDVIAFIDKFVTCSKNTEIEELVQRQQHNHSRTCKKRNKTECRFGFPLPPLPKTQILEPLPDDTSPADKQRYEKLWEGIQKTLNDMKMGESMEFSKFLEKICITEDDYMSAIRSSLKSKKVFLKRAVDEIRVNSYNTTLLKCWRANMDLQFVLDPYACAMYIVSYIAKSQRGMSNLLHNACQEARKGNQNLREQVRMIGHTFLTHVEISAQEAAYLVLQMPLHKASREVIFINTSPQDSRTVMLKSLNAIQSLPNDSVDVVTKGSIVHYSQRPDDMKDICLADFVSKYRKVWKKSKTQSEADIEDVCADDDNPEEEDVQEGDGVEIRSSRGGQEHAFNQRRSQAVIRTVNYNFEKDKENYCREKLMLFVPWENEHQIIDKFETFQDKYADALKNNSELELKTTEYNHSSDVLEKAIRDLQSMEDTDMEDQWDQLAPNTQCQEREDESLESKVSDIYPSYLPTEEKDLHVPELIHGLGGSGEQDSTDIIVNLMKDDDYMKLVRSLNTQQRQFFYHVMNCMKNKVKPFYVFLTGGAGVGKTAVVTALYQMLIRHLNKGPGINPDELKVLLGAPTGKAAYLIHGYTLHTLFKIPASQGFGYKPLTWERKNTLQCKFRAVRLLIIDEISMVGNHMFSFIHQRLQQIMESSLPFGGLSVIAVGDLYQLKPVFDSWIFEDLNEGYGPLAVNLWTDNFYVYQLTMIMRQKDDEQYAQLLNRLREGKQTADDIRVLQTRVLKTGLLDTAYPFYTPHIYLKNELVNNHNQLVFENAPAVKKISISAWDSVIGDVPKDVKEKIKSVVPNDCTKTMGLMKTLQTSVGSRVELSTNVNVEDGLANGSSGVVMAVQIDAKTAKANYIWVKFDEVDIGRNMRQTNKHLYNKNVPSSWTPISQVKRQFKVGRYKNAEVLRCQFPIRPASAKTAHRCQGDTMDSAVISFEGRSFAHVHYVALSRVKCLDRLHILKLNEKSISVSQRVQSEMKRLTCDRALQPSLTFSVNASKFRFIFHNVRSLHKHIEDIRCEPFYLQADLLVMLESKLSDKDYLEDFRIPGYNLKSFHFKVSGTRSAYGTAVYLRHQISSINCQNVQLTNGIEYTILTIDDIQDIERLVIAVLYISPKVKATLVKTVIKDICKRLQEASCTYSVVCGDFNINWLSNQQHHICDILGPNYDQKIKTATTDYGSLLDHAYTNIPDSRATWGVFDSYFSDHKPVWSLIS